MVAAVIEEDVAMCAKVLQLVNSAFFGLGNTVSSVQQAVSLLGVNVLRALVMSVELFEESTSPRLRSMWSAAQHHSLLVGKVARYIAQELEGPNSGHAGDAFLAGTLHEIGLLVIASSQFSGEEAPTAPNSGEGVAVHGLQGHLELSDVECHPQVGAYLLGLWGFPEAVVEAVAFHHCPSRYRGRWGGLLAAVHAADGLVHRVCPAGSCTEDGKLDMDFLAAMKVSDSLADWEESARELTAGGAAA